MTLKGYKSQPFYTCHIKEQHWCTLARSAVYSSEESESVGSENSETEKNMEDKTIGLSNSEWHIMENLWKKAPKTATQLIKAMETETGWSKSTTKTVLKRMEQKGYLTYQEGVKAREYYPLLKREEVVETETSHFINRLYNGSLGLMVNTLVKKQSIPEEEMEELYQIIQKARDERQESNRRDKDQENKI